LNDDVGVAIFPLLWSGYHRDIKIMNNNSTFSSSLALTEPELKIFFNIHNLFHSQPTAN
jgi:hypothetical protein